jgi:hypothetical protein
VLHPVGARRAAVASPQLLLCVHVCVLCLLFCVVVHGPLCSSTQFLNQFSALSEEKLSAVSRDISRLEKVLVLLETKLNRPDADDGDVGPVGTAAGVSASAAAAAATVPSLPSVAAPAAPAAVSATDGGASYSASVDASVAAPPPAVVAVEAPPPPEPAQANPADDPVYQPFTKMLKYGLPSFVVAHKMRQEGLDPTVLGIA